MRTGLTAILVMLVALSSACGDDETDDNDLAIGYVWGSIAENKDPEVLQDYMTEELRDQTTGEELLETIHCFPIGVFDVLMDQEIDYEGNRATITATYELRYPQDEEREPQSVEREWQFQRVEDGWLLADLPSCPAS